MAHPLDYPTLETIRNLVWKNNVQSRPWPAVKTRVGVRGRGTKPALWPRFS
jgi:hypothetical protein